MRNYLKPDTMRPISCRLKLRTTLVLILVMIWHTGCNDWIDIEPENKLIKQEFWKTTDDVMSVLAATYDALRGAAEKSFLLGEIRADHFIVSGTLYSDYTRIGENNISPTNSKVAWNEYYNTINLANTVMFYMPVVQDLDQTLTDELRDGMEAEMLFLRSLSYFYLVRIWKDVPLVLFPTVSDTVDFYLPKSPERVILTQITKDLKRASALAFTDKYRNDPVFYKGRANKYSIQALLADVLLWQEKYTECITYCDSIRNAGLFSLETNVFWFDLFYPGNSMKESLFEIQYDDNLEAQENPMYLTLLDNLRTDLEKIAYDEDNDIRFCKGRGPIWKYRGTDETGNNSRARTSDEHDANFIYYRFADVLLMEAEALAETGDFEDANYLVRQVAERAGVTHLPTPDGKGP
jgi:hypothetical protein